MSCCYQGCHNCSYCAQPSLARVCADWNGQKLFCNFNRQNHCGECQPICCTEKCQRAIPTLLKKQSIAHIINREHAINQMIRDAGDPRKQMASKGSKPPMNKNSFTILDKNERNNSNRKKNERNRTNGNKYGRNRRSTSKDKKLKSESKAKSKEYELCDMLAECLVNKFKNLNPIQEMPTHKPCCDECECTICSCHVQTNMTDIPDNEIGSQPVEQKIPDKWEELNEDEKALLVAALKLKTNHSNNVPIDGSYSGTHDSLNAGEDIRKRNPICDCMRHFAQNTCCYMRKSKDKSSEPYMQPKNLLGDTTRTGSTAYKGDPFNATDKSKTSAVDDLINAVNEIDGLSITGIEHSVDASTSMIFPNARSQLETLLKTINLAECALEACRKGQGLLPQVPQGGVSNTRVEQFLDPSTSKGAPLRRSLASPLGSFLQNKTVYDTMGPLADSANRTFHRPYIDASTSMPYYNRNLQSEAQFGAHRLKENPSKKSKNSLPPSRPRKSNSKSSQKRGSKLSVSYLDASTSTGASKKNFKSPPTASMNASTSMTSRKNLSRSSLRNANASTSMTSRKQLSRSSLRKADASRMRQPSKFKENSSIGSPLRESSRLPYRSASTIPKRVPTLRTSHVAVESYIPHIENSSRRTTRSSLQAYSDTNNSMGSSYRRSTKSLFDEYLRDNWPRSPVWPDESNGKLNAKGLPKRSSSLDRESRIRSSNSIGLRNRSLSRASSKSSASSGYSDKIIKVSLMSPDRSKPNVYAFVNKRENDGIPSTSDKVIKVSTPLETSGKNKNQTDEQGCRNQTFTFVRKCSDMMIIDDSDDACEQAREELAACLSCATAISNRCNNIGRTCSCRDYGKKRKIKKSKRRRY